MAAIVTATRLGLRVSIMKEEEAQLLTLLIRLQLLGEHAARVDKKKKVVGLFAGRLYKVRATQCKARTLWPAAIVPRSPRAVADTRRSHLLARREMGRSPTSQFFGVLSSCTDVTRTFLYPGHDQLDPLSLHALSSPSQ